MDRARILNALALLIPFSFAGVCDTWEERPRAVRPRPVVLAVTAPDLAPPGSEVMLRVHWRGADCGTRFVRFGLSQDREGIWVLQPTWVVPERDYYCLDTDLGYERIQRLVMPTSGSLRFRIDVEGEALSREVLPGTPGAERVFRLSVFSLPGSSPHPGVSLDLYPVDHVGEDGRVAGVGHPISVGQTDSTGTLDIDLGMLGAEQPWLFLARDSIARTTRGLALLAPPATGRPAEHMTLVTKRRPGG